MRIKRLSHLNWHICPLSLSRSQPYLKYFWHLLLFNCWNEYWSKVIILCNKSNIKMKWIPRNFSLIKSLYTNIHNTFCNSNKKIFQWLSYNLNLKRHMRRGFPDFNPIYNSPLNPPQHPHLSIHTENQRLIFVVSRENLWTVILCCVLYSDCVLCSS